LPSHVRSRTSWLITRPAPSSSAIATTMTAVSGRPSLFGVSSRLDVPAAPDRVVPRDAASPGQSCLWTSASFGDTRHRLIQRHRDVHQACASVARQPPPQRRPAIGGRRSRRRTASRRWRLSEPTPRCLTRHRRSRGAHRCGPMVSESSWNRTEAATEALINSAPCL
jgi:hypothetical protein